MFCRVQIWRKSRYTERTFMNKARFLSILNKIEADPTQWDRTQWRRGLAHCLAGHAQIDAGFALCESSMRRDARVWLDLSSFEADYLFSNDRTFDDLQKAWMYGDEYPPEKFSSDGFDCEGFDRQGFDRAGYGRDGYNPQRFNRAGVDYEGLDRNNKLPAGHVK